MKKMIKFALTTALICGICGGYIKNSLKMENIGENKEAVTYENLIQESVSVGNFKGNCDLKTRAKAAYVMDFNTKTPIYTYQEDKRLPIASMCKIMTLLLAFESIDKGVLDMDETLCISERAASIGGSQVFLEINGKYTVRELLKSIVVCSANDSCVAIAERLSGNEDSFVNDMNDKAREIGAENTLFANCTGLPKEPQYSCAKDVAIMLKKLLEHEEYYQFGKVWTDKFQHPEGRFTEITNTNKLIRFYDGCDGGKTGFTNEAGFCLAATAKRENTRIISVVIGEESSANRFEDVRATFDYAFAHYQTNKIVEGGVPLQEIEVNGGKIKTVSVYPSRSAYSFEAKGANGGVVTETHFEKIKAPIEKGAKVGELIVFKDGVEVDRVDLITANEVKKATFFDRMKEISQSWNG